jgi:hypothetical protein
MFHTNVLHHKTKKPINNLFLVTYGFNHLIYCGEYRSRTDDLLHAIRILTDLKWFKIVINIIDNQYFMIFI